MASSQKALYTPTRQLLPILLCSFLLSACDGPFADYSNAGLRQEFSQCDYDTLNAVGAQRCNNIKAECDKRKKASGFRC